MVNAAGPEASRQRFTAAQELGHHELHRFADDVESPTYLVDKSVYARGGSRHEIEANAFAAALLVPTEALKAEFSTRGKVELEQVVEIMRRYRVSLQTAVYRLHNSDRITPRHRDELLKEGDGHVHELLGKVEEPVGPTLPVVLEQSLIKLYRAGLLAPERLASSLDLTKAEVLARFGRQAPPKSPQTKAAELLAELENSEV